MLNMKKRGLRIVSMVMAVLFTLGVCGISGFAQMEGTILFSDDFASGMSTMWDTTTNPTDIGTVSEEVQSNIYKTTSTGIDTIMRTGGNWSNVSLNAKIKATLWNTDASSYMAFYLRYTDASNYQIAKYSNGTFTVTQYKLGVATVLSSAAIALSANTEYRIAFEAKQGVIRLLVNNAVIIQDYCNSVTSGTVGIETKDQAVDFSEVAVNNENVNMRQDFKTGSYVMSDSSTSSSAVNLCAFANTSVYDSAEGALHITSGGTLTLNDARWATNTDWKNTETVATFKIENIGGGITFRTSATTNNSYVIQFASDGIYKTINADFTNSRSKLGSALVADNKYHTIKMKNITNADNASVACSLIIDDNTTYTWTDSSTFMIPNGGGFSVNCAASTPPATIFFKSLEIRDASAGSDTIFEESFVNLNNWTV